MHTSIWTRSLARTGIAIGMLVLLGVLYIALFGWNWMRAPIERFVQQKTGRELAIQGDLMVHWDWPTVRLHAANVNFANPAWAQESHMVSAAGVEVAVHVQQLLFHRHVVFPEVRLEQAAVFLEQASDGRKSWLMDLAQQDESAGIDIGRVAVEDGALGYDDLGQKTSLRATLSTAATPTNGSGDLKFSLEGRYKGMAVKAQGSGGPVLALRDTQTPYPLTLDATAGRTRARLNGTVTGLLALVAVDMRMALQGDSLDRLYPLLGIAFPTTPPYSTEGHLLHQDTTWRYEKFSGRVGGSDLAGYVQVVTGGKRPALTADLQSALLSLDDLGPLIGVRPDAAPTATAQPAAQNRVLPELPFNAERWDSVDADVQLRAKTLRRPKALALEDLEVHLQMRDAMLTLAPLNFGFAGGKLLSKVTLDGRSTPIKAKAQVQVRHVALSKLLPTVDASKASVGEIHGDVDLSGTGNSVGSMLATSNGTLAMVVDGGLISQLMMEKAGLHIWEIFALSLTGDKLVKLRCAVADFGVKQGDMQVNALVVDTAVTTLLGSGHVNLAQEQLDLTFNQRTKTTSPLALRSPIYMRGSFKQPTVTVDKGRMALRAAGALALSAVNPLLIFAPLIDAGPGKDSDCGRLVREADVQPGAQKPLQPAR
jgi:uncharacterized protein involved in outer membrane biogenesis